MEPLHIQREEKVLVLNSLGGELRRKWDFNCDPTGSSQTRHGVVRAE